MTVSDAVKEARSCVTLDGADGSWRVSEWDENVRAWRVSDSAEYFRARSWYAQSLAIRALAVLGIEDEDYSQDIAQLVIDLNMRGARWIDIVREVYSQKGASICCP